MSTASLPESILNSHWLPQYAKQLNEILALETARRARFYDEITESQKAEFIDGRVVVHSPARIEHVDASGNLFSLLRFWVSRFGGRVTEKALCVFDRNDYEPDIIYYAPESESKLARRMLKFPVPDFIVEVLSESTERNDRGVKFDDYAEHGVQEYWIVDPLQETVEQYLLNEEKTYTLKLKAATGEVTSRVVRNFTIPVRAIFDPALYLETTEKLRAKF